MWWQQQRRRSPRLFIIITIIKKHTHISFLHTFSLSLCLVISVCGCAFYCYIYSCCCCCSFDQSKQVFYDFRWINSFSWVYFFVAFIAITNHVQLFFFVLFLIYSKLISQFCLSSHFFVDLCILFISDARSSALKKNTIFIGLWCRWIYNFAFFFNNFARMSDIHLEK